MCFAATNILFMRNCNHALGREMTNRFPELPKSDLKYENRLSDRMIKQLLNLVIVEYCDLSASRKSVIYLTVRGRQIIALLATVATSHDC